MFRKKTKSRYDKNKSFKIKRGELLRSQGGPEVPIRGDVVNAAPQCSLRNEVAHVL
jgi:hypothetical protein